MSEAASMANAPLSKFLLETVRPFKIVAATPEPVMLVEIGIRDTILVDLVMLTRHQSTTDETDTPTETSDITAAQSAKQND